MIKSMTGYGKGEYSDGKRNITIEIRSVNHRYSDISVKMPRRYSFAEDAIKKGVKEMVKRGKIEVSVQVENLTEDDLQIKLNTSAAHQYMDNLQMLRKEFGMKDEITLAQLAGLPDVLKAIPDVADEEEVTASMEAALETALERHDRMRTLEGRKLTEDLMMRGGLIREYVGKIEERAPDVSREYAEKLNERIQELVGNNVEVPQERILMEAAIFADKSNITEELVRLNSHIDQLEKILSQGKSDGKKLDFLVQEMNREANTIGSKANDIGITEVMLEIKSEVEKIREQVQNIE